MDNLGIKSREVSLHIIKDFFKNEKRLSNIITSHMKKHSSLNQADKKIITFMSKGIIRFKTHLDMYVENFYHGKINKLNKTALNLLRMGIFQIKFMDNVPNYAAVSTTVQIAKTMDKKLSNTINAILREIIRSKSEKIIPQKIGSVNYAKYYSHPKWLINKWINSMGNNKTHALIKWNNKNPATWFRINTHVLSVNDFKEYLNSNKINYEVFEEINTFFKVENSQLILNSNLFKEGKIYAQNPSSGLVAKLVNPKSNEIIIDLCSSPGGKTSHMSELLNNKGKIFAYDINPNRIKMLNDTIKRMKIKNVVSNLSDIRKSKIEMGDKILIDAPCTGTGAISKHPDIKWRRKCSDIKEMQSLQKQLLASAAKQIKNNGTIIYSTCSLENEENWIVINDFLKKNPNYKIQNANKYISNKYIDDKGAIFTYPPQHNIDGSFAVRLSKND